MKVRRTITETDEAGVHFIATDRRSGMRMECSSPVTLLQRIADDLHNDALAQWSIERLFPPLHRCASSWTWSPVAHDV